MNKEAIPQGFPVGRVRLTKHLTQMFRQRELGGLSRKTEMISPYGGTAPSRRKGSTFEGDVRSIQARREGTLSQFVAAKKNPQDLRTQSPPTLSTGGVGHDVASGENVNRGTGIVRDAEKQAHQLLRERLAQLRV